MWVWFTDHLWEAVEALTIVCTGYGGLVGSLLNMDAFLHDITPEEERRIQQGRTITIVSLNM